MASNTFSVVLRYRSLLTAFFLKILYGLNLIDKEIAAEAMRRKKARILGRKYRALTSKFASENKTSKKTETYQRIVWTCWFQGEENAPEIVKKCLKSIKKNAKGWEVRVLTNENFREYAGIPDYMVEKWNKGIITNAHFSDILRCKLLHKYGGIWMDATCFLSEKIPDYVSSGEFFCFKRRFRHEDTVELGSWFMFSRQNNPLLGMAYELECDYWKKHNVLDDYFLFHIFVYIAKEYYPDIWDCVPHLNDINAHALNTVFLQKYDEPTHKLIEGMSFVQKLTYKLGDVEKGTFYDHFLKEKD